MLLISLWLHLFRTLHSGCVEKQLSSWYRKGSCAGRQLRERLRRRTIHSCGQFWRWIRWKCAAQSIREFIKSIRRLTVRILTCLRYREVPSWPKPLYTSVLFILKSRKKRCLRLLARNRKIMANSLHQNGSNRYCGHERKDSYEECLWFFY